MELPVSDKVGGFADKPHIKKGYYPGQLLSVEERKDQDGKLFEGKYGRQIIMTFAIFKPGEEGEPTDPIIITEKVEGGPKVSTELTLPKFVYHQYKDKDKPGEFQTAITANGKITKVFVALGWEFDASKNLKVNEFINKWAELNIDDFDYKPKDGDPYKASTIIGINKYEGPNPNPSKEVKLKEKKNVKKQLKHDAVKEEVVVEEEPTKVKELRKKIDDLKIMNTERLLSDDGLAQATEQINKQIEKHKR